jgi:iron-sulfur cluster repair protein YtfE (RIC family)
VKRDAALVHLSRDHHHGLVVAQRLSRATAETADEARAAFLEFWHAEGRAHFRAEEEILLPSFASYGSATDDAVIRVLTEHVDLRRRAADLAREAAAPLEALHALGEGLASHIRHEERTLFPLIETTLPADALAELAAALERAH